MQIRRTDKLVKEAKFYPLEEYMNQVDNYYLTLELQQPLTTKLRVYLASDYPTVFDEAVKKYT